MSKIAKAYEALKGDLNNIDPEFNEGTHLHYDSDIDTYFAAFGEHVNHKTFKYVCTVEEFNNYKPQKTVVDAVNELKGKWPDGYVMSLITKSNDEVYYGEFNDEVKSMSTNYGRSSQTYAEYKDAYINSTEKETKVDYTSQEFWKDAPEGVYKYATMDPWGEENIYWLDDNGYWFEGECYAFGVSTDSTTNFVLDEFTIVATRPKPSPVFTKAMSDAGELPKVGMEVIVSDEYSDVWGDSLHLVGCPVQVMATFDGLGIELGKNIPMVSVSNKGGSSACFRADMCMPIDTRTDKEKAFDDLFKIINDTPFDPKEQSALMLERIVNGKVHGVTFNH